MNTVLNEVKGKLPQLSWDISKNLKTVKFINGGTQCKDETVTAILGAVGLSVTVADLREAILTEAREAKASEDASAADDRGEIVFLKMPLREAELNSDTDLNDADDVIWADLKFTANDTSMFYVKDGANTNTYTAYLTAASSSDKSDVKTIKEAYFGHNTNRPEQLVKAWLKDAKINMALFNKIKSQIPATAWKYLKIKAFKKSNGDIFWDKLVIPSGSSDELYQGFIDYESDFRTNGKHNISEPTQLTNDPNEVAIAYINLDALNAEYAGQSSKLWDEFLLQRFHKPEYVSIFKAWAYSVAVGKNNSRQEMWLYGNGGTGKSCLCKAFIKGFNELAKKDICLAASKDTGKSNFNSELLNKHLLVYPDAKNLKGGMSEFKHNATGGDYMRIEGKCKAATSAFIYLKCLTCSNELPKVDMTDRSQSSRYIVLPFTLDDAEMKKYGLMDKSGQMIGSSSFQHQLDSEFKCFLASCKEHYEQRCITNSNIDAHEALDELAAIELDEVAVVEEFVDTYFEITTDTADRLAQKDFRKQCLFGIDSLDEDTGVKIYKDIKLEAVRTYLEKKYDFKWKQARVNDQSIKAVISHRFGIKLKSVMYNYNTSTGVETVEQDIL